MLDHKTGLRILRLPLEVWEAGYYEGSQCYNVSRSGIVWAAAGYLATASYTILRKVSFMSRVQAANSSHQKAASAKHTLR